jgi:GNAT superfamily N-acetyltransferase
MQATMRNVIVRQIKPEEKDLLKEVFKLRVTCREEDGFITHAKFPNGWFDEADLSAHHFVALIGNELVAAARVNFYECIDEHPYYPAFSNIDTALINKGFAYFSRIAVHPNYRQQGLSTQLVQKREEHTKCHGIMNLLTDVTGFQVNNFLNRGYKPLGKLDLIKIKWEVNAELAYFLMHKTI